MDYEKPETVTARTAPGEFMSAKRTEISPLCFGTGRAVTELGCGTGLRNWVTELE